MNELLLDDNTFQELKHTLGLDETHRPQISVLHSLGMRKQDMARMLDNRRYALELGVPTLQSKLRFYRNEVCRSRVMMMASMQHLWCPMKQVGLDNPDIVRLLTKFPRVLEYRTEKTITRHIDFFLRMGVEASDIPKIVMRAPMTLGLSIPNTLQPRLEFLTDQAHVPITSLGKLVGRHPLVLTCTEDGMRERVDFLTNEVGMPLEDLGRVVLAHPQVCITDVQHCCAALANLVGTGAAILCVCHADTGGIHAQCGLVGRADSGCVCEAAAALWP